VSRINKARSSVIDIVSLCLKELQRLSMSETFVHLHVHSDYTLSKGGSKVSQLVERAKELGIPAMALTDDANMFGAMEFSKKAVQSGIQPIIGTKLWFDTGNKSKGSILLLAKDSAGYANICHILLQANRPHGEHQGGSGIIPVDALQGRTDGVIALTGGKDGCLYTLLKQGRRDDACQMLDWLRWEFGDRLYVEICRNGDETPEEARIESHLIDIAFNVAPMECSDGMIRDMVPVVAATEIWYATPDRHDTWELLKAVESKGKVTVEGTNIVPSTTRRYHMRSAEDMRAMFSDLPEAVDNAVLLAVRCAFKAPSRKPILPTFKTEDGRSEAEEMRHQARQGLEKRLKVLGIEGEARKPYDERLEYELGIIEKMQFPGYFLIVADFIQWAKSQGIPVGPGRGSGAGSLVAYSLYITDLDPLAFGLLFERFLNPERVSMPDFDVDFCQDRREEVIQYVREKYGEDYVSMIATFGEIKSKTAIKDVGRVMQSDEFGGFGFSELDRLTKLMPMNGPEPMKLRDALNNEEQPDFRHAVHEESKYRLLVDSAIKVEGLLRNQGMHAAGVIIAGQPLDTLVPVGWDSQTSMPVCQFNMKHAEESGLVKFDFLGLKTLSVIRETLEHIRNTTGEEIDLGTLPLDDKPTYEMLSQGFSNGVFQFESDGMKKWFRELKPSRFEDLIALAALYRPGPMDMIPTYVDCKNGRAEPQYPEPVEQTKPFLEETFGIMVYQEQVMQVAQVVAGYSLGGADLLRRAMGKKIPAEMAAQRDMFIKGATGRGTPEGTAGELFDLIAKFAGYGFNKSHAAAYALIAYQTAWLKRHYPAQFMAALLTYETDDPARMAKIKEDMDAFGIKMLPPCIEKSDGRFKPELHENKYAIRFGLTAIKGISGDLAVLNKAREGGPFKSLADFYKRAGSQFNKGQLEQLVAAGAFDRVIERDDVASNRFGAASVLAFLGRGGKKAAEGQTDLFGGTLEMAVPKEIGDKAEWGNKLDREFNAVGFYFADHPLDIYEPFLRKIQVKRRSSLQKWMLDNGLQSLKTKRLSGLVEKVDRRVSSKGNTYYDVHIAEKKETYWVKFFGDRQKDNLEEIRVTLENAKAGRMPVIIVADLSLNESGSLSIFGRDVHSIEDVIASKRGKMKITVDAAAVLPSLTEQKELRRAKEDLANGKVTQEKVDEVERRNRELAAARKEEALERILRSARQDANPDSVPVILCVVCNGETKSRELEGRYVVSQSIENAVKATDGVVSFKEEI